MMAQNALLQTVPRLTLLILNIVDAYALGIVPKNSIVDAILVKRDKFITIILDNVRCVHLEVRPLLIFDFVYAHQIIKDSHL